MKTYFLNLLTCLLIGTLLLFVSCIKQEAIVPSSTNTEMFCKIDGNQWISIVPVALISNNHLLISAISFDNELITLTVNEATVGTHGLNPNLPNAISYKENDDIATLSFDSNKNTSNTNYGTVVITKKDVENKTISGTFETEVHRPSDGAVRIITEGSFNDLAYSEVFFSTPTQFSATIDSVPIFEATFITDSTALGNLIINGRDSSGNKIIELTLPEDIAIGIYGLGNPDSTAYGAQYHFDSNISMPADSGKVLITEHQIIDKYIKGIFNFEASELGGTKTASITNGSFELTYE